MRKKSIKENEFFGAPGGTAGTVNYQAPLGTHTSPDVEQDPKKFHFADNNKAEDKNLGIHSNTAKDSPDPINLKKTVDAIYSKKNVPTSDQVKAGLDYELHNMIKPDKRVAKELVLKNLRTDPAYYGKLHQLNVDDKSMTKSIRVDEAETKKIFAELAIKKDQKYVVNSGIVEAMQKTWEDKKKRRDWQKGDITF
jgi:hypothetical protein